MKDNSLWHNNKLLSERVLTRSIQDRLRQIRTEKDISRVKHEAMDNAEGGIEDTDRRKDKENR